MLLRCGAGGGLAATSRGRGSGVSPRKPLPQVPVSSKAEAEMVGSHRRRLLDVGIILTSGQKTGVSRVAASGARSR